MLQTGKELRVAAPAAGRVRVLCLAVFLISLVLRLVYIWETSDIPSFRFYVPDLDVDIYWNAARFLGMNDVDYPRFDLMMPSAPFFVYFLVMTQTILGESLIAHRLLMAVLGSLTQVLILRLSLKMVGLTKASMVVALILVMLPSLIHFDTVVLKAAPELFLLAILLNLLTADHRGADRRMLGLAAAAGALLSVLFLSQQATFLFVFPVLLYMVLRKDIAGSLKRYACLLIMGIYVVCFACSTLVPSKARPGGEQWFVSQFGLHLYMGLQESCEGFYTPIEGLPGCPAGQAVFARMKAEAETGRRLTQDEVNEFYIEKALSEIRKSPGRAVGLILKRTHLFLNDFEVKGVDYLGFLRRISWVIGLSPVGFGLLIVLSTAGIFQLCRERRFDLIVLLCGLVGAVWVSNLLTMVTWRLRLPAVVPLGILSAFGLSGLTNAVRALNMKAAGKADAVPSWSLAVLSAVLVSCVIAYWPVVSQEQEETFQRKAGGSVESAQRLEFAMSRISDLAENAVTDAERICVATLCADNHRDTMAFKLVSDLVEEGSKDASVHRNYLKYLVWLGRYEQASEHLTRVRREIPEKLPEIASGHQILTQSVIDVFVIGETPHDTGRTASSIQP